jgi:CheY-like chemotaxis protein
MVVEDDAMFSEALGRWLEALGFDHHAVATAELALEHLSSHEVDVIVGTGR